MNNPQCAVCGHISRLGAAACEMCDTRFDAPAGAGAAGPYREHEWQPRDSAGDAWPSEDAFSSHGAEAGAGETAGPIPSPPFKGAGDVISPTLAVYRKHFVLIGILVLVTTLPVALLQYGVMEAMRAAAEEAMWEGGSILSFTVTAQALVWLLTVAGTALLAGSLVFAVLDVQRAGRASAAECLRRGLGVLPKVFLVTLLYSAVTVVGYILLIVPGIIFSLMYAVCVPVAVAEGRGPFASLKRSAALTDGYKGLIFMTYFLWGLVIGGLSLLVTWSFAYDGALDMLPTLLLQSAVIGMLNSSQQVLTVYVYLGLLNEHGFEARTFTPGPEAAAR